MENNQTREITVGEIFKKIFKHKILIVSVTLIVAILGTLLLGILPNRTKKTYVSNFQISSTVTGAFGLPKIYGNYTDMVSFDNLSEVKSKDEDKYAKVDVEEISENYAMTIVRKINEKTEETTYTIEINAGYFEDYNEASSFITDAIRNVFDVTDIVEQERANYASHYANTLTFDSKVTLFQNQLNKMVEGYDKAIATYGDVYVNGKALSVHRQEIVNFLAGPQITEMVNELRINCYAEEDARLVTYFNNLIDNYNLTLANNEATIAVLRTEANNVFTENGSAAAQPIYNSITSLVQQNENIKIEIEKLQRRIDFAKGEGLTQAQIDGRTAFKTKLDSYNQKVEEFNDIYYDNVIEFYNQGLKIVYLDFKPVIVSGESSVLIMAVISLLLGLAIACIVAYVVDLVKKPKQQEESKEVETQESNS